MARKKPRQVYVKVRSVKEDWLEEGEAAAYVISHPLNFSYRISGPIDGRHIILERRGDAYAAIVRGAKETLEEAKTETINLIRMRIERSQEEFREAGKELVLEDLSKLMLR